LSWKSRNCALKRLTFLLLKNRECLGLVLIEILFLFFFLFSLVGEISWDYVDAVQIDRIFWFTEPELCVCFCGRVARNYGDEEGFGRISDFYLFIYSFWVEFFPMIVMHFLLTGLENFVLGMCCFWVGRLGWDFSSNSTQMSSEGRTKKNHRIELCTVIAALNLMQCLNSKEYSRDLGLWILVDVQLFLGEADYLWPENFSN
jgi:hypothetical protein